MIIQCAWCGKDIIKTNYQKKFCDTTCCKKAANKARLDRAEQLKPTFARHFELVTGKEINLIK